MTMNMRPSSPNDTKMAAMGPGRHPMTGRKTGMGCEGRGETEVVTYSSLEMLMMQRRRRYVVLVWWWMVVVLVW
jgi:hypothetical protein